MELEWNISYQFSSYQMFVCLQVVILRLFKQVLPEGHRQQGSLWPQVEDVKENEGVFTQYTVQTKVSRAQNKWLADLIGSISIENAH